MQLVTLDNGEVVELRDEGEPIPEGGGFFWNGEHVVSLSVKDGVTTSTLSHACYRIREALKKKAEHGEN